jgi:hypothetical protein
MMRPMTFLFTCAGILLAAGWLHAQPDTLRYDNFASPADGQLFAATRFDGELDAIFTARFSPRDKCRLTGALIGFSVVKFQPASGNDTLLVYVFEQSPVPPNLVCVGTFMANLGEVGFPIGNINTEAPLSSGARDQLRVDFSPPLVMAPRREFLIGIALRSAQRLGISPIGRWNGFCVLINPFQQEYGRYGRYQILEDSRFNAIQSVTASSRSTLFLRAMVEYDSTLADTTLTPVAACAAPEEFILRQNYPNPFRDATSIEFMLEREQFVMLTLTDALGRVVAIPAAGVFAPGTHRIEFTARNFGGATAGVYRVTLLANGRSSSRTMMRLR